MSIALYPRLKNYQHVDNLKNSPLLELARGENDTLREKLVKKALERKWKTNTIRTQATKFNAISNYLASLTNEEAMSGTLLSKLDENILLNFDLKAIQNEVDIFREQFSKEVYELEKSLLA